jgi:hypothetical protein
MSVSGSTPSPKMDFTHQFESHTVELARIQELELDSTVLEYYEQVEDVFISYISNSGRKCSHYKHFDLLIIRRDEIVWEECKEDSDIEDLVADNAAFYQLDKGVLRSAPCEQLAMAYGFKFRVWTTKNMPPIRRSNINLLVGRLLPGTPPVPEEIAEALRRKADEHFGITLADLIKHVPDARLADAYTLMAKGVLHANLSGML